MEKEKLKKQITFGVILIIIGIACFMKDFVFDNREKVFSKVNLELTELLASNEELTEEIPNKEETPEEVNSDTNKTEEENKIEEKNNNYESYIGILEIDKIGFSKGFYKKESNLNNVKFNIKILPQSSYPDETKGNVIIIGHSGNYNNSYFKDLYKLENGDLAIIKYNNKTYTYKTVNIYTEPKDGTVAIYRDETKNCLTLITCTKDDSTTQTIYIMELVDVK